MQIMSRGHLPCLSFSQYSLDLEGLNPLIGDVSLFFHREHLRILNQGEESTVKIFEQSIQTPCGLYWRQVAREQLLRMGNEDMAKTRRQFNFFFPFFFVMGCQNGFDLLRDLLIINCIICFLLHSGQKKQTRTHHQRPGQISYHQRGWLDRSWRSRLSADGGWKYTTSLSAPEENSHARIFAKVWRKQLLYLKDRNSSRHFLKCEDELQKAASFLFLPLFLFYPVKWVILAII